MVSSSRDCVCSNLHVFCLPPSYLLCSHGQGSFVLLETPGWIPKKPTQIPIVALVFLPWPEFAVSALAGGRSLLGIRGMH